MLSGEALANKSDYLIVSTPASEEYDRFEIIILNAINQNIYSFLSSNKEGKSFTVENTSLEDYYGSPYIKFKNTTSTPQILDVEYIIARDNNKTFVAKASLSNSSFVLPAEGEIYLSTFLIDTNLSAYDDLEAFYDEPYNDYNYHTDGYTLTTNDNNGELEVTFKNNTGHTVDDIVLEAIYYKNNKVVNVQIEKETFIDLADGDSTTITFSTPWYKALEYDSYEVIALSVES